MDIKEFADKFIKAHDEAMYEGIFDALEKLEDPNVVIHILAQGQESTGWEFHKRHILNLRQALSNIQQEWKYLTSEGTLLALSYKMSGMFTGEIPGMLPPTGNEVTSNQLCIFRVKNGKVTEQWANGTITGLG